MRVWGYKYVSMGNLANWNIKQLIMKYSLTTRSYSTSYLEKIANCKLRSDFLNITLVVVVFQPEHPRITRRWSMEDQEITVQLNLSNLYCFTLTQNREHNLSISMILVIHNRNCIFIKSWLSHKNLFPIINKKIEKDNRSWYKTTKIQKLLNQILT